MIITYTRSSLFNIPSVYHEYKKSGNPYFKDFIYKEMGLEYVFEKNRLNEYVLTGLKVVDEQKWFLAKIKFGI